MADMISDRSSRFGIAVTGPFPDFPAFCENFENSCRSANDNIAVAESDRYVPGMKSVTFGA